MSKYLDIVFDNLYSHFTDGCKLAAGSIKAFDGNKASVRNISTKYQLYKLALFVVT